MFEASQRRSFPWSVLAVVVLMAVGGLAMWMGQQDPEPSPTPPEPQRIEGTPALARSHVEQVLGGLDDARIWHLSCTALPCIFLVRLHDKLHGVHRISLERDLEARGWHLTPKGTVHVLDAARLYESTGPWMPKRVFYTFAVNDGPLDEEARESVRGLIRRMAAEGDLATGPW